MIAAYILNQLDEDGFFTEELEDVADYYHVPVSKIEEILKIIQKADPVGIASASPEEAIRVQLSELRENGKVPETYLIIAEKYLHQLLKKQYKEISQELKIPINEINEAAELFQQEFKSLSYTGALGNFSAAIHRKEPGLFKSRCNYQPFK